LLKRQPGDALDNVSGQPIEEKASPSMTIADAAAYCNISEDAIVRALRRGSLPGAKIGREWRIQSADLTAYLRGQAA